MLPALPTPPAAPLRRALARLLLCLLLALPLGLSGCQGIAQPSRRVLLSALAVQIDLTQGAIAEALDLEAVGHPDVSRVRVEEQQVMDLGEGRGLRLTGRFDWRLAGDAIRVDTPFEIFLQRGERGQSWRLARPMAGAAGRQEWQTYPLPLDG